MFKPFHVNAFTDLTEALAIRLNINKSSAEYAKTQEFLNQHRDKNSGEILETLSLVWKKVQITIEPVEGFMNGGFTNMGYTISSKESQDLLFTPYTVTGFDNLLYSLAERFKLKPSDNTMVQIKRYLKSLIPADLTDLTSPCGLYLKGYPVYINALATYSSDMEMWVTEYVVSCGDKRAELPTFNIA